MKKKLKFFCSSFAISLILIFMVYAMLDVDAKARRTGYGDFEEMLAYSRTEDTPQVSFMGETYLLMEREIKTGLGWLLRFQDIAAPKLAIVRFAAAKAWENRAQLLYLQCDPPGLLDKAAAMPAYLRKLLGIQPQQDE